jgi:threonine dehydratase
LLDPSDIFLARQRLSQSKLIGITPLERVTGLSREFGVTYYQKLELAQATGSFKIRGAMNKLLSLSPQERERGVVTASAGNHGLGVAYAAGVLGIIATIVVPETASRAKVAGLKSYPVELIQHGEGFATAEAFARQLEREQNLTFVSPYNDPQVIAGQGTIGLEILEALPDVDVILVPVGGGGLISGIGLLAKSISPKIKVIGVQSEASPFMQVALQAGKLVDAPDLPSLADGLAGAIEEISITFPLTQKYVDEVLLVAEEAIAKAIRYHFSEQHLIVEGSGAVGLAALLSERYRPSQGAKVVNLVSGRNIATDKFLAIINGK